MKQHIFLAVFSAMLCAAAMAQSGADRHFLNDAAYRQSVEQAYRQKAKLIRRDILKKSRLKMSTEEREAMQFVYAYMPVADALDYTAEFYLASLRSTFATRREMPWGKSVPEMLFRHFVVPLRVNNENLDSARIVLARELRSRVKGLTMSEAVLEVNHWCHEHVTYAPSDARTLSPLSCIRNALGRCGEESTLTVAALRAIGIPARQVYTPRWAHTDDNHAWVEAWADGRWHFLGACEPEPVLDLGWFNAPASRAMLMHTRAFGDYRGPEEVVLRTKNYTEINLIPGYATTAQTDFCVVDDEGKPVEGARVEFKIYNYAEYYTAVNKYTDAYGHARLSAGLGDMLVWASKNGRYGYTKVTFGKDSAVTIRLSRDARSLPAAPNCGEAERINIVPPAEHAVLPDVTPEMAERNKIRLASEDSIRKAYERTFYHDSGTSAADGFLRKARGNWRTIRAFLDKHADNPGRALALLATLSDKDLRDMPMRILDDSYAAPYDCLCPRVEDEMITRPYKQVLCKAFPKKKADAFRRDPQKLATWVSKSIRMLPDTGALSIPMTPVAVWQSRIADSRSRDIFYVSLARSLGIDARKDVVTSKVQHRQQGGEWTDVNFSQQEHVATEKGTLQLTFTPTKYVDNPKYYSHFTISKIGSDGHATLLNFDEGDADMGGGTTWQGTFRSGISLDAGRYLLVTGTRLASGSVLSQCRIFVVAPGQRTSVPLELATPSDDVSVIGNFDSESRYISGGREVSILSQTGRGYFVVGLLGVGQEPTNHALHDIERAKADLESWGRPILLLFESEEEARAFREEHFDSLPSTTIFGIDKSGSIRRQIAAQMKLQKPELSPIFFISDTFNRVVFCSQGYTIGLGEQMVKVIKKL